MWSRTYVCCAVPLYNSGIYAILSQFFIVSLVAGILTFAAPHIVAVSLPSFAPYIFGGLCILVAVIQTFGFFGVFRERPSLFKNYVRVNATLVIITLLVAAAFIALSASRHSTALQKCEDLFSSQAASSSSSAQVTSGSAICNIWTQVQIGIMGLLFLILALCESYFLMYQSIYASEQKLDHARYEHVVNEAVEEIRQSGLWDDRAGRPSAEYQRQINHGRNMSKSSGLRNEVFASEPSREYLSDDAQYGQSHAERYEDAYREEPFKPEDTNRYSAEPHQGSVYSGRQEPYYPSASHDAYAQPTPVQYSYGHANAGGPIGYPDSVQNHPLEGQNGRKAPKLPSPTDTSLSLGWDPAKYQR